MSQIKPLQSYISYLLFLESGHYATVEHVQCKGKNVKADIALPEHPISELRGVTGVTCYMGSHSVTCHPTQVNAPRLTPSHARWHSIYLPRRDGRLSWPSWLDSAPARVEPANAEPMHHHEYRSRNTSCLPLYCYNCILLNTRMAKFSSDWQSINQSITFARAPVTGDHWRRTSNLIKSNKIYG